MMITRLFLLSFLLAFSCALPGASYAQEQQQEQEQNQNQEAEENVIVVDEVTQRIELNDVQINLDQIPSLFLTANEQTLIADAKEGLYTRPPTESEFDEEQKQAGRNKISYPPSVREISLGGILYQGNDDWTIWINSQKITPQNIPPAVLDIDVQKDYIKLKWLDFQTNQIFPVKLRTHQRFNFDSRMFLPGSSSGERQ